MNSATITRLSTRLNHALTLAELGFRVFPLAPGTRVPPKDFAWKDEATRDPNRIREWWASDPNFNVGVAPPAGTVIVDADVKDGKPGLASLELLDMLGLPESYRVKTPSGGVHVYLKAEHAHRNRVDSIPDFRGIDIRSLDDNGRQGYVVGPGSTVEGKTYTAIEGPIESAPDWFEDILLKGAPTHSVSADRNPLVELDRDDHVALAIDYLKQRAPEAVEGAGGNETTYKVAAHCRGYGLSPDMTLDIMLEHWNEQKASPPWQPDELQTVIGNAYKYASGAWGGLTAAGEFDAVDIEEGAPPAPSKQSRWQFEKVTDLRKLPPTKWLVKGWVPENATGIVYGKWGSGKTFVLFDLALHLAYGRETWHGATLPGGSRKVLVIAREGHQGFTGRIDAFKRFHGLEHDTEAVEFMRVPISFMKDAEFKDFAAALKARQAGYSLILIDTVARVLPGVDMSTADSITTFMDRCDLLTRATGATTIGVHHQNKGGTMYGSIYFEANSDFVFEVTRTSPENQPLREGQITCTKMKDGEDRWRKYLRYDEVPIGDDLEMRSSLAVAEISSSVGSNQLGDALEIIRVAYDTGNALSAHPRSRSHGRYAIEKIAKDLRIDEKAAEALVKDLLRQQFIEERQNSKTKSKFLAPASFAVELNDVDVAETGAET